MKTINIHNIQPIAIDLGALYTGFVIPKQLAGKKHTFSAHLLELDKKNFTVSLQNRLAKRHQRRSQKRKKLVKKLFLLFSFYVWKIDWENTEHYSFILGLFNRRGFTYQILEEENQEVFDLWKELTTQDWNEIFNLEIPEDQNIVHYFHEIFYILSDPELDLKTQQHYDKILKAISNTPLEQIKEKVKERFSDSTQTKTITNAIKKFQEWIITLRKHNNQHFILKHRKHYLKNITKDIENNQEFQKFLQKKKISTKELVHIVGNFNNLPLKILRKYFNHQQFKSFYKNYKKKSELWDKEKLKQLYIRWFRSWRPNRSSQIGKEQALNQKKFISRLKNQKEDIVRFLKETEPQKTIPPYESQNNRNPPKCQTLRINAHYLNKKYSNWKKILIKILSNEIYQDTELKHQIVKQVKKNKIEADEIIKEIKKSSLKGNPKLKIDEYSIILQIILDQTKQDDPLHIREQISAYRKENPNSQKKFQKGNQIMQKFLDESEIQEFLTLAEEYYQVSELAQRGLWIENHPQHQILQKCNCKPKLKKNAKEYIIRQILGVSENFNYDEFVKFYFEEKLQNKKIRIVCKELANLRARYKNQFPKQYKKLLKSEEQALLQIEKKEKKILSYIESLKHAFQTKFHLEEPIANRLNSPYLYIQLHDVLEKDTSGFYRTCIACTKENEFRSYVKKSTSRAYAKRLTADSIRPFDSQIVKIIEKKAFEVFKVLKEKICEIPEIQKLCSNQNQLKNKEKDFSYIELEIPLLIEENDFSFEEQIYELKNQNKKRKEYIQKRDQIFIKEIKNKFERIKKDSNGICAYTGKKIEEGEWDHIIPQSKTKRLKDTSFNHEANLIYVSKKGNQEKKNKIYTLENLNKNYLKKIFNTQDIKKIKEEIQKKWKEIQNQKKEIYFQNLDQKTRIYIRHALFIPELKNEVITNILSTQEKAIVNGTQKYFIKYLNKLLFKYFQKNHIPILIKLNYHLIPALEVHNLRNRFFPNDHTLAKGKKSQSFYSHIIDAMMLILLYLKETPKTISFPDEFHIIHLERKPLYQKNNPYSSQLFNDSIYKENFVPLIIDKEDLYIGFNKNNKLSLKNILQKQLKKDFKKDVIWEILKPFMEINEEERNKNLLEIQDTLNNHSFRIIKFRKRAIQKFLNQIEYKKIHGIPIQNYHKQILYDFFTKIHYNTIKQDVKETIKKYLDKYLEQGNSKKQKDWEEFIKNQFKILSNKLTLPVANEWIRFSYPIYKQLIKSYNQKKEIDPILEERIKQFFTLTETHRKHKKERSVFSLPIIPNIPGTLFRLQRYNPFYRENIFQIIAANGIVTKGFIKDNHKIHFNRLSPISCRISKKSIPIPAANKNKQLLLSNQVICHDEWISINLSNPETKKQFNNIHIYKLDIAPATQDRAQIKIKMAIKDFLKYFELSKEINASNLLEQIEPKHLKYQNFNINFLPVPRKNNTIKLWYISRNEIEFEYTTERLSNDLKNLIESNIKK